MKNKVGSYVLLGSSILLLVVFYMLSQSNINFSDYVLYDLIRPAIIGLVFLTISSFISIFMSRQLFRNWLIFTFIFILGSMFLVGGADSSAIDLQLISKDFVALVLGITYLVVSLGAIIYQVAKNRKRGS